MSPCPLVLSKKLLLTLNEISDGLGSSAIEQLVNARNDFLGGRHGPLKQWM